MKQRLKKVGRYTGSLLAAGVLYILLVSWLGFGIPCLFHTLTGLACPGCGVSRMCLALLRLDIAQAATYNLGLLLSLPFLAVLFFFWLIRYIRTGQTNLHRWQTVVLWSVLIWLLLFGILRNVPACGGYL